jgi:hypothetical protein
VRCICTSNGGLRVRSTGLVNLYCLVFTLVGIVGLQIEGEGVDYYITYSDMGPREIKRRNDSINKLLSYYGIKYCSSISSCVVSIITGVLLLL